MEIRNGEIWTDNDDEIEIANYFKVGDKVIFDDSTEDYITEIRDYGFFPISTKNWIHVRPSSIQNIPNAYYEKHPEIRNKQMTLFEILEVVK